jgi:hypothetical protein
MLTFATLVMAVVYGIALVYLQYRISRLEKDRR